MSTTAVASAMRMPSVELPWIRLLRITTGPAGTTLLTSMPWGPPAAPPNRSSHSTVTLPSLIRKSGLAPVLNKATQVGEAALRPGWRLGESAVTVMVWAASVVDPSMVVSIPP